MELIYLTANFDNTTDWENEEYATNFYDYNDFGLDLDYNSGVIVFRNSNSNPYYGIYTFGEAILYYSDERINYTLDDIHESITMKKATEIVEASEISKKKLTKDEKIQLINQLEEEMKEYAKELNFEMAAQLRDAIIELRSSR
jgi:hypothetical protein